MPACFWLPSRYLAAVHVVLAVVAALALLLSGLPRWAGAGAAACCLLWAAGHAASRYRAPAASRLGLRYGKQAGWELWSTGRGWQGIEVSAGTLVTWRLIVLRYRQPGSCLSKALVLPADVLDAQSHRRLRLWLRFTPLTAPAAGWFPWLRAASRDSQG